MKSPVEPADLDLDGTGLDESKCWIGRAGTLMLSMTVYTLLVLQTKDIYLAVLVKDELQNNTWNKKVTQLFYIIAKLIQFFQIMAAFLIFTPYNVAGYFGYFRETTYKTSGKNLRR